MLFSNVVICWYIAGYFAGLPQRHRSTEINEIYQAPIQVSQSFAVKKDLI
jgi:hypothetical protein